MQDAPGLIGAWVRVHPHDAPLEREGVRRNNAKNESGLLPKFQNDECLSSMRVRAGGRVRDERVECGTAAACRHEAQGWVRRWLLCVGMCPSDSGLAPAALVAHL